ncbi:MAG TPA: hypothetical protein VK137_09510 [Planctomycetaceae bacterium]|nr:hypothetical protein [Planctomycetaceae bacterium]
MNPQLRNVRRLVALWTILIGCRADEHDEPPAGNDGNGRLIGEAVQLEQAPKLKEGDAVLRDVTLRFLEQMRPDTVFQEPAQLGRKSAEADLSSGFVRILYYGKPWSQGKPLIDDETGYPVTIANGCCVGKDFTLFVDEYNLAMKQHFNKQ